MPRKIASFGYHVIELKSIIFGRILRPESLKHHARHVQCKLLRIPTDNTRADRKTSLFTINAAENAKPDGVKGLWNWNYGHMKMMINKNCQQII